ncbi:hypothetical protein MSPP1_000214 [Malassezia sp. CBS 17886]|nr:hypothetical protein MSPP1_000214 [Malassezia sp. CBS 17886]
MRAAMACAVTGDDVGGADPMTAAFQQTIAELTGKEAALFVPSGTQSNQLALLAHVSQTGLPTSIVCDARAHVLCHETGGLSFHARATPLALVPRNGHHLTLEDVAARAVLEVDQHYATTRVVSLENTIEGLVHPQDEIVRIGDWAHGNGLAMHLDGARLWNVAAALRTPLDELCAPFDTVSLCLSKGLGAPVGSVLVGPRALMDRVFLFRKLFGGGMRQSGVLAAAAHTALHDTFPKLRGTHAMAQRVAAGLAVRGIRTSVPTETNMVWWDPSSAGLDADALVRRAAQQTPAMAISPSRLVFHHQLDERVVDALLGLVGGDGGEAGDA